MWWCSDEDRRLGDLRCRQSAARSGRNAYVADRQEVGTIVEAASDATREALDGVLQAEPDFEAAEYSVHDDEDD